MTKKSLDSLQNAFLLVSGRQSLDYIGLSTEEVVKQ